MSIPNQVDLLKKRIKLAKAQEANSFIQNHKDIPQHDFQAFFVVLQDIDMLNSLSDKPLTAAITLNTKKFYEALEALSKSQATR